MAKSFNNREGWIWMNGEFIPWKQATSHIINQGLHYASTVFEGERAYNGKIFKSKEHTQRLFKSAKIYLDTHLDIKDRLISPINYRFSKLEMERILESINFSFFEVVKTSSGLYIFAKK